ncbi:MAG: hypothetical protein HWN68_06425 [Desulfobacterales bacterium]|nr:hypothetical protein [Desulfobacterales bacterium]
MINDEETGQPHSCEVFADWLESKNLHGPTLSSARYELWRIGPEEANKRRDLQEESKKPTLLWNAIFPSGKK